MSEYVKYQHVEKLGNDETEGITEGRCYIFPKIDGTNAQIWFDGSRIRCGSRNRELFTDNDNAGFMAYALQHEGLCALVQKFPNYRFFGEWLVPHSLKTYNPDNWRKFYLFDVMTPDGSYLAFPEWEPWLKDFTTVEYIPPLRILVNPKDEHIMRCLDENTYLIDDGNGTGEGIVIKNYNYQNKYGRQTWAKVVTNDFKTKNRKEMGAPESKCSDFVEQQIVARLLTVETIDKIEANIKGETGTGWRGQYIPRLIGTAYHDFVTENIWAALKEFKNPAIDFKRLQRFCVQRIKELRPDLF